MHSTRRKACGVMRVQYIKLGLANDRQRCHQPSLRDSVGDYRYTPPPFYRFGFDGNAPVRGCYCAP